MEEYMRDDILQWLQHWYHGSWDGEWEYDYEIRLLTLSNPGWSVFIDIAETPMSNIGFNRVKIEREEQDWIHCWVQEWQFKGASGPLNLIELLDAFRSWVMASEHTSPVLPLVPEHTSIEGDVSEHHENELLQWLQQWYYGYCDGEWEREKRIRIKTVDVPGWSIYVNLTDTRLSSVEFSPMKVKRGENDWIECQVRDEKFRGTCGTHNLIELLGIFRLWAVAFES